MNRAQRRAEARQPDPRICEHGNAKKTDGTGTPMCPHGCGFITPVDRLRQALNAYNDDANPNTLAEVRDAAEATTTAVLMPRQHGRPQTAVTKAIGKYASITAPPDYRPFDYTGRGA